MTDQHVTRVEALRDLQTRIGQTIARLADGDAERDPIVMECRRAALAVVLVEREPGAIEGESAPPLVGRRPA